MSEDFESGTLSEWTARTGGNGSATVSADAAAAGLRGAALSATTGPNSYAYIRAALADRQRVTATAELRVVAEGASGANVPLIRLFDSRGSRILSVYRQNLASGKVYIEYGGATYLASQPFAMNTWTTVELHVVLDSPTSLVSLSFDGVTVHSAPAANVSTRGIASVQFGNETKRQAFTLHVDDVLLVDQ